MRKIAIILLELAAAGGVFFTLKAFRIEESVQIRTETEPIYNHFPNLPQTSEIQWCSKSSGGIGLTTTTIYIFAFYDYDISSELQAMEMEIEAQNENLKLYFVPNEINMEQKWRHVENANLAFQSSVKITQQMNTTVYINELGTILYIEAISN